MSYDIYLTKGPCPTCGHTGSVDGLPDPTYNLTTIFDFALTGEELPNPDLGEVGVVLFGAQTDRPRGLRVLSGMTAEKSLPMIEAAIARLTNPDLRAKLIAMEPPNKWGTLSGAIKVMQRLRQAAEDHRDYVWEIE